MLALRSLGPGHNNIEKWPHGTRPLPLRACEGDSVWVCMRALVFHLTIPTPRTPPPSSAASELELTEGKWETIRGKLPPPPPSPQVEGEVLHALTGRSPAVRERRLVDGCGAEMMHTDSAVSGDILRASAAAQVADNACFIYLFLQIIRANTALEIYLFTIHVDCSLKYFWK